MTPMLYVAIVVSMTLLVLGLRWVWRWWWAYRDWRARDRWGRAWMTRQAREAGKSKGGGDAVGI